MSMKRRAFLKRTSAAALAAGVPLGRAEDGAPKARAGDTFDSDQWALIAAVQDHLLPSEPDAPGAREINATAYLDRTLADPKLDPEIRELILNGIGRLNEIARERAQAPFPRVEPGAREDLLRYIAASPAGERWLSNLITYTLEALLADPIYGGNPGGIGWRWLEHDPGRPRPTPDKVYGRLGRT